MTTHLFTPVRALLLAVALAFATQAVDAHSPPTNLPQTTARTSGDAAPADRDGVSLEGVLVIALVVGVVVLLAWVCSRVGEQ